jgi:RimJ/RimL family protein N-acetyltransferase
MHALRVTDKVALRPAHEDDLPWLEALTQDRETVGEFEWFGWSDLRRWRRGWEENGLISPDGGTLIVTRDGQPVGFVTWRRQTITVPTSYCWEIGIILLPEARGQGYGTQAQRLLARYLFAHTTVHRIWAGTEVNNTAEQRSLEKAGFTREGVSRATGWRDGEWRDGVTYSLLRTDPLCDVDR